LARHRSWCRTGEHEIIIVVVLKEVEKRADIGVTLDDFTFYPFIVCLTKVLLQGIASIVFGKSRGVPGATGRQDVGSVGDGRHDVYLYGNRAMARVLLPAIR
jgi:hypothetical protein